MISPKPIKLAQHAENCLLSEILEGEYPPGSALPAERELAEKIGVTRPTLREALQRLARDGWLDIRQGKQTIIRDYMKEGGLGVISTMARMADRLPANFITYFLGVRSAILPAVSRMAAENQPAILEEILAGSQSLADAPHAYTDYDWNLQLNMMTHSGNPFFRVIFNNFALMYHEWGLRYFRFPEARLLSAQYYGALLELVRERDGIGVEARVRHVMADVTALWESRIGDIENEI